MITLNNKFCLLQEILKLVVPNLDLLNTNLRTECDYYVRFSRY